MAKSWSVDKFAVISGESEHRLSWYADSGLLHRDPNGMFAADSLRRIRMIQHVRRRGGTDEQSAGVAAGQ